MGDRGAGQHLHLRPQPHGVSPKPGPSLARTCCCRAGVPRPRGQHQCRHLDPGLPCAPETCSIRQPFLPCSRPAAMALPAGERKAEPVARAQQNLQRSHLRKGNGSILTWFSREAPCHGVSTVAVGTAEHMAA